MSRRRFFACEVIQTSAMDCGPAALKCLLEGFGIPVSYGRLREACQTSVDGTSIDTLEVVAGDLGLDVEQVLVPVTQLKEDLARDQPALVVVALPNGSTHFVVGWRAMGPWVELMDPASGRRWVSRGALQRELYVHEQELDEDGVSAWLLSGELERNLRRRLRAIGCVGAFDLLERARTASTYREIATLDAATSMVESLLESDSLRRADALEVLRVLYSQGLESRRSIPKGFWFAMPSDRPQKVWVRGALLLRVRGLRSGRGLAWSGEPAPKLSRELSRAVREPQPDASGVLFSELRGHWRHALAALIALVLGGGMTVLEAVLFRAWIERSPSLTFLHDRLGAGVALLAFSALVLALEIPMRRALTHLGRVIEVGLRVKLHAKLPRLADPYLQSRLSSDMAERGHAIHDLRELPELASQIIGGVAQTAVLFGALLLLDRTAWPLLALLACSSIVLPLLTSPLVQELDLRARTHKGALARFHLDALVGLLPARAHGAEQALSREHEALLVEWVKAQRAAARATLIAQSVASAVSVGIAALAIGRAFEAGMSSLLLFVYWLVGLAESGRQVGAALLQIPSRKNRVLRVVEPLGAPEVELADGGLALDPARRCASAASIELRDVTVTAGGHVVLDRIDLSIAPGQDVAIVGSSGAGKSSLVRLLLGFYTPVSGVALVDGRPIAGEALEALREDTAWIDPEITLWNRTLYDNVRYGCGRPTSLGSILKSADLDGMLGHLPEGMQTELGDGGARISGGEGQRVRFARGLLRGGARLVLLDEPFRGLTRAMRASSMQAARAHWPKATMLAVTHDVEQTLSFSRVLVVERGKIVEDGSPRELSSKKGSRYAALLESERRADALLRGAFARRIRVEEGCLHDEAAPQ
ncbi:MAG: ATP-binding cassette domain-containing protein [Polyangiaceae bacterium]